MTGFGRGSATTDTWLANIEIGSVNRKQAEVVVQMPRELSELEGRIRKKVLGVISRGRAQVSVNLERAQGTAAAIQVDTVLAKAFHDAFNSLGKSIGQPLLPTASDYLRQPGIISTGGGEIDPETAWLAIEPAVDTALTGLSSMRETEGRHLKHDFLERLDTLKKFASTIAESAPGRPTRQRDMLAKRLRDLGLELDLADERVAKEIAIFADRCDISEEITRLDSHFAKFREYLDSNDASGRPLDFLCQELFREINTIGSKANEVEITRQAVAFKTELERIREQVQNVE